VEQPIITGKGARAAPSEAAPRRPAADAALLVRNVRIDSGSDGQRLDNFLAKLLKGVPKTHLYRVIRSGEVRVNKCRAAADTRLGLGDEVRIPPMRVADRAGVPDAPGREFPVVFEDDHLLAIDKPAGVAVHGGSGESFGVILARTQNMKGQALRILAADSRQLLEFVDEPGHRFGKFGHRDFVIL